MAQVVRARSFEIDSVDPQTSLDDFMETWDLDADNFLTAVAISLEERNNKAKIVIFYAEDA